MCLQAVMFKLLSSIESQLESIAEPDSAISEKDRLGWNETTVVVLSGITNLLADYLEVVSSHGTFAKSWQSSRRFGRFCLKETLKEVQKLISAAMPSTWLGDFGQALYL